MKNQHSGLINSLGPPPAEWINGKEERVRQGKQQHVACLVLVKQGERQTGKDSKAK